MVTVAAKSKSTVYIHQRHADRPESRPGGRHMMKKLKKTTCTIPIRKLVVKKKKTRNLPLSMPMLLTELLLFLGLSLRSSTTVEAGEFKTFSCPASCCCCHDRDNDEDMPDAPAPWSEEMPVTEALPFWPL